MKKISILISALLLSGGILTIASESSPDNGGDSSTPKTTKTVPLTHKPGSRKGRPTKSRTIEGSLVIVNGQLYMTLPLDNYPLDVEIADASGIGGYWNGTFMDPNSCSMLFDGEEGNYEITITDSEDSVFVGYFTLD